ncbi:hypothetical protein D3C85_576160 [compost metagenome]
MLSEAQICLQADDPYEQCLKRFIRREADHYRKVFHFADGSFLTFTVTYTPADAGRSFG